MAELRLSDTASAEIEAGALVVTLAHTTDGPVLMTGHGLPRSAVSHLKAAIDTLHLSGDLGEVTLVPGVPRVMAPLVALTGLGARRGRSPLDPEQIRLALGAATRRLTGRDHIAICPPVDDDDGLRAALEGAALGAYATTGYRSRHDVVRPVQRVTVLRCRTPESSGAAAGRAEVIGAAVALCRDLVNDPPNILTPERFVEVVSRETRGTRTAISVLDDEALRAGGFGGILGVSAGSSHGARLVTMSHRPRGARGSIAFVGKGITFDSGGLCLKTPAGMLAMKTDMAGAAAVACAVLAIAHLRLPIDVTGYLALAENMPGASAQRPGDVVAIRGGRTVEIVDTDAEGRMVLADALALASESTPEAIIDIATLTGAQITALGPRIGAVLANDDQLRAEVIAAGRSCGERLWALPIPDDTASTLRSGVADLRHKGPTEGGMLYAAGFLREFVGTAATGSPIPWAHLDIAGPALNRDDAYGYVPKGGTGYGVRTLVALAERFASR